MELITLCGILCLIATFVFYIYNNGKPKEGSPPGPWRLPCIGNAVQMGVEPFKPMFQWAKKYGSIYSIKMGSMNLVVLSDAKLVKEAFGNPVFSGKPDEEMFLIFSGGKYGILATDGEAWQEQRRFTVRHLRDMGFGKNRMEPLIMDEVNEFIQWLKTEEGNPVSLNSRFSLAVLNALWMIIHGYRYKQDDPRLSHIFEAYHDATSTLANAGMLLLVPYFSKLFPNASGWKKLCDILNTFQGFFRESIVEHEATLGDEPRDFVDAYLNEIKNQEKSTTSFNEENGMKNFLAVIGDLFVAGYETTSITLTWLFLYLSMHQPVLKKFQNEIDMVVGKSRQPTLADRHKMLYTDAVLHELLRITSIIPIGVFHRATQNTTLQNYNIAKDCFVTSNLWFIHHNPEIWGDPENFRPERFLTEDGTSVIKNENFIPFSIGKRACIGESLAKDELFLFATNICQRFDIQVDPANPNPSLEPEIGFTLAAKPYSVIMKDRLH